MLKQDNTIKSLAHTKWNCKYHIVFAPKYRRKVFCEDKRLEIREILRTLCKWKGVDIIEGGSMPRP
jgi:putative transposase